MIYRLERSKGEVRSRSSERRGLKLDLCFAYPSEKTGRKKLHRERSEGHLVSSDFYWETYYIWLNQRKEQVANDLNDQAMKSSFVDLKLK